MKTLKFKDGTTVDFVDGSTLDSMRIVAANFSDLDVVKTAFEKDGNLAGATFDGEAISQRVYTGVTTEAGEGVKNVTATFTTRSFTHDEIVDARLSDLEDTLANM